MSYNSGNVNSTITSDITLSAITGIIYAYVNVSTASATNHFTVPANKIWRLYYIHSSRSAVAQSFEVLINAVGIFYHYGSTTWITTHEMNLQNTPITLTAGQHISTGASGGAINRIITIAYIEEDA